MGFINGELQYTDGKGDIMLVFEDDEEEYWMYTNHNLKKDNDIHEIPGFITRGPGNIMEDMGRQAIQASHQNINEPHCIICGDTKDQCKLVKAAGKILCEFCFNIQMNM